MKHTTKLAVITALIGGALSLQADVEANWKKHCASCHGADGKGQTTMGKKAGAKDYTDAKVQESFTDEQAFKATKEGIEKDGKPVMKPYAEKLTDDEIKELVAHIRSFKK
ncbi:MAG: cytochrome c [Verrucomicrobia bacterium]|jgi:cytochrome c553|nr:cytochrome c [Verrucomicrobiota bacterium]